MATVGLKGLTHCLKPVPHSETRSQAVARDNRPYCLTADYL